MARFGMISRVTFPVLRADRAGSARDIASFELVVIPNKEYAKQEGVAVVQRVVSLLAENYEYQATLERGKEGEQCDAYIFPFSTADGTDIVSVREKYWSVEQIVAFKSIVRALSNLHGWQIEDEKTA